MLPQPVPPLQPFNHHLHKLSITKKSLRRRSGSSWKIAESKQKLAGRKKKEKWKFGADSKPRRSPARSIL